MKIEIKNRFNGKVLFIHDQENNSIKATLEAAIKVGADLSNADLRGICLRGVYLRGVYLRGVDLSDADLRDADLRGAYLGYAKLRGANLSNADLSGANLHDTDLAGVNLRDTDLETATYGIGVIIGNNPLFILGLTWPIYIFKNHIKIGCQIHTKQEWLNFDDVDIAKMEPHALAFWTKWKRHILWMAFEGSK
jgi:uncharacterized protein YjbI with pentapeptide repeats